MDVRLFSPRYTVRRLTAADVESVFELSLGNPLFFEHCPPAVTRQSVLDDMQALPPGMTAETKYYVGFFDGESLVAVLDLILGYPAADTVFIGLFMVQQTRQGRGEGSAIISACLQALAAQGWQKARLAYAAGNPQSAAFWRKNGFVPTGQTYPRQGYTAVAMERWL